MNVGAAASLVGVVLSQRYAVQRDQASYKRTVQSARQERLRSAYTRLAGAGEIVHSSGLELYAAGWIGETDEVRGKRVGSQVASAEAQIADVIAALKLEP